MDPACATSPSGLAPSEFMSIEAQILRKTVLSFPSAGVLFRRFRLYVYCYFSWLTNHFHKNHKPLLRNSVHSLTRLQRFGCRMNPSESQEPVFTSEPPRGSCSSDRFQRDRSPSSQPRRPPPERCIFPLKPYFHHILQRQHLSPGHCSSGRCAISWNCLVRSPGRSFPIPMPEKLGSS